MTVKARTRKPVDPFALKPASGKGVPAKPKALQLGTMSTTATGLSVQQRLVNRNPGSPVEVTLSRGPTRFATPISVHGAGTLNVTIGGKAIQVAVKAGDGATAIARKLEKAIEKATKKQVAVDLGRTLPYGDGGSRQMLVVRLADSPPVTPMNAAGYGPLVNRVPNPSAASSRFVDEPTSAKDGR